MQVVLFHLKYLDVQNALISKFIFKDFKATSVKRCGFFHYTKEGESYINVIECQNQ